MTDLEEILVLHERCDSLLHQLEDALVLVQMLRERLATADAEILVLRQAAAARQSAELLKP
jgi:hypothetical protein